MRNPISFAEEILAELPEHIRSLPILAGGSLRSVFDGTEPKDFDLFFRNHEDFKLTKAALEDAGWELVETIGGSFVYLSPSNHLFNLVGFLFGTPAETISRFDFRCCALAVSTDADTGTLCFISDEGAIEDAESKRLTLRWNNGDERTMRRLEHYFDDYGYTAPLPEPEGSDPGDTRCSIGTREAVLRELIRTAPTGQGGY